MPKFKCDILGDFQTLCSRERLSHKSSLIWTNVFTPKNVLICVTDRKWTRKMAPEAAAVAFHHFYVHSKVHQKYETCVRSLAFVQAGAGGKNGLGGCCCCPWGVGGVGVRAFAFHMHTIRKVKFLSKNSIMTKTQHFHEFFIKKFFWQFFSWNQSCQQLKSPKPQHFHEFFTQNFFDNFSREIKVVNS